MKPAARRWGVDQFTYWLQVKQYSPRTIALYTIAVRNWHRWCESESVEPLKARKGDILDWQAALLASGRKPSTLYCYLAALHVYYRYLLDEKLVKRNIARDVPLKPAQVRSGEPYTPNELARMHRACRSHQERAVFLLMAGAGLRREEVWRVSRNDCNFETRTISVLGKGSKYRLVRVEPMVMDAVQRALEFSDRLCHQKSPMAIWEIVRRLAERAGIPGRHHPHRLRFTFAVEWCEAGGQESELQIILGHSNPKMTLYYSRKGRERRALKTMETLGIASRLLGAPEAAG
jgi:integrase/recombinase XerD